jgi:alpha-L-fucosidase 2
MAFGRPWRTEDYFSERIALNEESVWYGGPAARENPDALSALPRVRRLLLDGRVREAEELADNALTATPRNGRPYQALGELVITAQRDHADVSGYRRELDLARGIATTRYRHGKTRFESRAFVSAPDQVVVLDSETDGPELLNLHVYLRRRPFDGTVWRTGPDIVGIEGRAGPDGVRFCAALAVRLDGGRVRRSGQSLVIEGARRATLLVAAATTFNESEPRRICVARVRAARARLPEDLERRHVADHENLFGRVSLRLGEDSRLPTDARIARVRREGLAADPALVALQYQFGRYLTIAASRPGSLPTNLQGIWCDSMTPIWNCNYTINVNLQMSYWPAESGGLPECHLPLFAFFRRLVKEGRRTARKSYGCRGFVAHHTSDLWGDPAPTGGVYASALWPLGGAWLALHAWEHYRHGGDLRFLRDEGYPILREAARFFTDYLVRNAAGEWVAVPSVSPENFFLLPDGGKGKLCAGAAMDGQILREVFTAASSAAAELGLDAAERRVWLSRREGLPPTKINEHGRIHEWNDGQREADPGHRHVSHLFALFPGNEISPLTTPDLARAADATLRGKLRHKTDRTGWSQAWMANMFARLHDGDAAAARLERVLCEFTHPGLLGNCPPLNLDSNFGVSSAVAEMLLQSHRDELHVLPALPATWPDGEVRGLRARGGFEVALGWRAGRLARLEIRAAKAGRCRVRAPESMSSDLRIGSWIREGTWLVCGLEFAAGETRVLPPFPKS